MYHKIDITASEMLEMREQGLSNHDIAKSLDISYATVCRYIGRAPKRLERLAAFADTPPKREILEERKKEAVMMPKYEPKPREESYDIGILGVELDHVGRSVRIGNGFEETQIPFDLVPDLVQFLAWAMRTRMEVKEDAQADEVREPESDGFR